MSAQRRRAIGAAAAAVLAAAAAVAWWVRAPAPRLQAGAGAESRAAAGPAAFIPGSNGIPRPALPAPESSGATAPAVPSVAAPPDADVAAAFDPAAPPDRRLAAVEALAARRDERAAGALRAIAAAEGPLRVSAIEALGRLAPDERVATQMRLLLEGDDPLALAAAVRSLARQEGDAAVPLIGETLRRNRRRPDGFEDTVCGACVDALGITGAPAAVPFLADELEQTVGRELQFDYGSQVVAALRAIGHPSARPALQAYAEMLRKALVTQRDNPLGRQYLSTKIDEANAVIDSLR